MNAIRSDKAETMINSNIARSFLRLTDLDSRCL